MTGKTNRYGIYKVDHSTFGGIIYLSDFTTDYGGKTNMNGSAIAKRIAGDKGFDEYCRRTIQYKERGKYYEK